MKVILKIGYQEILLPDDTGLQTLLRALAKGVECHDRSIFGEGIEVGESVRVEAKLVPKDAKYFKKPEPDDASPAARPGVVIAGKVTHRETPRLNFG